MYDRNQEGTSWEHVERFDFFLNKYLYVIYMPYKTNAKSIVSIYPLITYHERVLILERARGMWKHKKSDPILELKKMRKEWARQSNNFSCGYSLSNVIFTFL